MHAPLELWISNSFKNCKKNCSSQIKAEIEQQLDFILEDKSTPDRGEERVASLTAGKRVPWAEARQKFFMSGQNARSLKTIESAAFAVSLDEDEVGVKIWLFF